MIELLRRLAAVLSASLLLAVLAFLLLRKAGAELTWFQASVGLALMGLCRVLLCDSDAKE